MMQIYYYSNDCENCIYGTVKDYSKIKMGGGLDIENFTFSSEDVPQGVRITQSSTVLTADKINIKTFT